MSDVQISITMKWCHLKCNIIYTYIVLNECEFVVLVAS